MRKVIKLTTNVFSLFKAFRDSIKDLAMTYFLTDIIGSDVKQNFCEKDGKKHPPLATMVIWINEIVKIVNKENGKEIILSTSKAF